MAIDNLSFFNAMNREEVKPPFPHPHRPLTSQEAHFAIMEKVNACIQEVNHFEQRVRVEIDNFMDRATAENNGFKEAIQASYNAFMETVQREVNSFEISAQNNFDLFRNDIDKRVADFETAINNSFETLQSELVKASNAKIEEMEQLKISLNQAFTDYKATLNSIVNSFKADVKQHMEEQDGKIEEYKQYMVDNILSNTRKIFNEKASNGEIIALMTDVYGDTRTFKGSLTYDEIQTISDASNGDYYFCTTDEHYYQRTETAWVDIGNGEKIYDDYEVFKADAYRQLDYQVVNSITHSRIDIDNEQKTVTLTRTPDKQTILFSNEKYVPLKKEEPYVFDIMSITENDYGCTVFIVYNKTTDTITYRKCNETIKAKFDVDDFVLFGMFINEKYAIQTVFNTFINNLYLDGNLISYIKNNDVKTEVAEWAIDRERNRNLVFNIDTANNQIIIESDKCWLYFERSGYTRIDNTIICDLSTFNLQTSGTVYALLTDNGIELVNSNSLKKGKIICMIWYSANNGAITYANQIVCHKNIESIFNVNGQKYFKEPTYEINNYISGSNEQHNSSDVGCLDYMEIGETDYSQLILYGQSLGMGWEAPEVITTNAENNCYMVGSSPMINHGNDGTEILNPLVAVKWSSGGEQPIVSATNAFAKMYRRFVERSQKFIGTNCGEGGQSIEKLMKQCVNGTNYYTTEFLETLTRTKNAVESEGKTVSCSAIIYMQGEYNYTNLSGAGLTSDTDATNDKEQYKAYLKQLKDDMQADIMAQYEQTKKPLFFIYQVAGNYINNKEMSINMAQVEFAQENKDVILLNSTYGVPDYSGGHLSTNGYRWYGELIAKQLYKVFVKGENFKSVNVEAVEISGTVAKLCCHVPVAPLVFDTHTKEAIANNGFKIYKNGTEISIASMSISGNVVEITCSEELTGKIEIIYGGYGSSGSGNLRDSDNYTSLYTYYDDRTTSPDKQEKFTPKDKDGNLIYGQHYPLFNWCNQFYYATTV